MRAPYGHWYACSTPDQTSGSPCCAGRVTVVMHVVLTSRQSGRPEAACIERHPAVSASLAQALDSHRFPIMWTLLSLRRSDRVTATSARQARLLNARYATIPDNLDLAILEVAPPKPSGAFKYYRRTLHAGSGLSTRPSRIRTGVGGHSSYTLECRELSRAMPALG